MKEVSNALNSCRHLLEYCLAAVGHRLSSMLLYYLATMIYNRQQSNHLDASMNVPVLILPMEPRELLEPLEPMDRIHAGMLLNHRKIPFYSIKP